MSGGDVWLYDIVVGGPDDHEDYDFVLMRMNTLNSASCS